MDYDEFVQEVMHVIALQGYAVRRSEDGTITMDLPRGEEVEINPRSFYRMYCNGLPIEETVTTMLAPLIQGREFMEALEDWKYAATVIRPHLIPSGAQTPPDCPVRDLVPGVLRYVFACDHPRFMTFVTQQMLETWQVSLEALDQQAMANLGADKYTEDSDTTAGIVVFHNETSQEYTADLVLRRDLLDKCAAELKSPELVIALPSRDKIALIRSGDPAAAHVLGMMTTLAYATSSHALSMGLFTWKDGKFATYGA